MSTLKLNGATNGSSILKAPDTGSTGQIFTMPASTGTLATTADTTDLDGAVVINESGADVDFRVESDGEANMLVVDGGNNAVGIGSATPDSGRKLHIEGGGTGIGITFKDTAGSQWGFINDANLFKLRRDSSSADHIIVDADGSVTMPNQPCFSVHPTAIQSNVTGNDVSFSMGSSISATEIFDIGSNVTGMLFTAPVTGKYQLSGGIDISGATTSNDYGFLRLATSNRNYTVAHSYDWYDWFATGMGSWIAHPTFSLLVDMDANDTAYLELRIWSGSQVIDVEAGSNFTGILVA